MHTQTERNDLTQAYTVWAYNKMGEGWKPTLLTMTFNEIGGGPAAQWREMCREVDRVYGQILTRFIRRPKKVDIREMPLWFVSADLPVFKRDRDHLRDLAPNAGRHLHAFALTPPETRDGRSLEDVVDGEQGRLSGGRGPLFRVHAVPVVENAHAVVDYALKAFRSGRVNDDQMLVLPRTHSEMMTIEVGYQQA